MSTSTSRPSFVGPDWMRCTDGLRFVAPVPDRLHAPSAVRSRSLWERTIAILLRAQAGDFEHVAELISVVEQSDELHLRDAALEIFAMAAPQDELPRLVRIFEHPDLDTRLTAYAAVPQSCCLALAPALAAHRARTDRYERQRVMDQLCTLLEVHEEGESQLLGSSLSDPDFCGRVDRLVAGLRDTHGLETAIYNGAPVSAEGLASQIGELLAVEEPEYNAGEIGTRLALLEGFTGWPYADCLDDDCDPIPAQIAHSLNSLRQSERLDTLEAGKRYFFGHEVPIRAQS